MTDLDEPLKRALLTIYRADGGTYAQFTPLFVEQADHPVAVDPSVDDVAALLPGPVRALAGRGLLDLEPGAGEAGFGSFRLTDQGHELSAHVLAPAPIVSGGFKSSWEDVRPVLKRTVELWDGQDGLGFVAIDDVVGALGGEEHRVQVARSLEQLESDGYVKNVWEGGNYDPIETAPETKALQEVRGWPGRRSDDAVVEQLLTALEVAIERTDDPEERTKLQRLAAHAREVGKGVLASAIVAAGQGAL